MKKIFLLLAILLTLGFTSCTPEELVENTKVEQVSTSTTPPSEEAEEDIEPNE